jgi:uncharacterized YccA/Bax inhibitor family protein
MPNPMFNESTIKQASTTWAPPTAGTDYLPPAQHQPVSDGPISTWHGGVMTVRGSISATMVLFALLLASATAGWMSTPDAELDPITGRYAFSFPMLAWVGVAIGFVCVLALWFKPQLARIVAPVYAIAQGFFVGALSKGYEQFYDGIVLQAAGATIGVLAVMLTLYRTRIIRVTNRFRRVVITATLGVMALYLVSFVISLFGGNISFINSPSLLGIAFSVFVAGLAAFNLMLDFDFIEKGAEQGLPKFYEWYAAFGLLVTLVWLYLEMLRLLAKLRQN